MRAFYLHKYSLNPIVYPILYDNINKLHSSDQWICCHDNFNKNNMPCQSQDNNLHMCDIPSELSNLNILETHLVTPVIPFMKIVALPKGSQKGIHGPVVCIPTDVAKTVTSLPSRPLADATLILVKLKRKLQYTGHHVNQTVDPLKVINALTFLKHIILSSHP